ncbi:MAG: endolytic transglycosylase MltG, partial [Muribaculaceae bacterium]|nr:endolytic transglycosylase MltG [Muribaculaceae bacterium]
YIIITSLAAGIILLAAFIFSAPYFFTGTASAAVIRIPREASDKNLKDTLQKYFDPEYSTRTLTAFKTLGRTPAERYGAYEIPEGTSPAAAARILSRGAQTPISLTINGVRDLRSFLPRISSKFNFSTAEILDLLNDSSLMASYGLTPQQAPALFLNDTYYLYWTASAKDLIDKLAANYKRFWTPANREKAADLGLTPAEITIVASIVDEETNVESEKGRVGRLYINRLQKGMKLQADPTVRFALNDFTIKRVTGKHLSAPGPYNTYRVAGLPPGPIRTVSARTLQAVLDSQPSDDLYMCAKEDFSGTHNFASTYEEHLQNARKYQKALDERGIK